MKVKELSNKTEAELTVELTNLRKELEELSIKLRSGQLKNVRQVSRVKKDVARILTLLSQK